MMHTMLRGGRDPRLEARVVARRPLYYDPRPDGAPPHVRAASGIARLGEALAVIQDDAAWLALVEGERVRGVRLFEDALANKARKPDFEACFADGGVLYALGSGSAATRERVARVRATGEVALIEAPWLYAALRAALPDAELNVEGAALLGGALRLFQRGNGAGAVDATIDLDWAALRDALDGRPWTPDPRDVVRYDLGALDGVRLTFTDATPAPGGVAFLAAAEDSPDAILDGPVAGSVLGVIRAGSVRWAPLVDASGTLPVKAEGLLLDGDRARVVLDADDPELPAELLTVELRGPW